MTFSPDAATHLAVGSVILCLSGAERLRFHSQGGSWERENNGVEMIEHLGFLRGHFLLLAYPFQGFFALGRIIKRTTDANVGQRLELLFPVSYLVMGSYGR